MSSRRGTKRNIIEIDHPGQEQTLGQRERSRARRADTTSPVLTRQDRPSSSGLRSAAAMNNGTGAIAAGATDRTSNSPSASGAALVRADNEPMSSTGAGSVANDQAGTPSEDDVSDMAEAGPPTPTQSGSSSHGGPEAQPPSTGALARTGSSASSPAEEVAHNTGQPRGADGSFIQAATVVTTLTQSRPRRSSQAGTGDREARPDPAADPRWEAALRAVGVQPAITREEPEGTQDATALALTATDGGTPAVTRQVRHRVRRSAVPVDETIPAEPSTDLEVNGPRWDSHVVEMVPETEEAIITRQRVLYQAGRRVFRGRSAEDQALILRLQNQLANDHERAESLARELERFHTGAR